MKNLLKSVVFLVLLFLAVFAVQRHFKVGTRLCFQSEAGFYEEKRGSLDGVYIGASNVYAFWQPPVAWKNHGIAVLTYSVDALPSSALKAMMIEARKTQPDALYIINLNTFKKTAATSEEMHRVTNYLNPSFNKYSLIWQLADIGNIPPADRLEYYFPIIRFHSRWSELTRNDFLLQTNGRKMGYGSSDYYKKSVNLSKNYLMTESLPEKEPEATEVLLDLLDYIEKNSVKALFVIVPQALKEEYATELNSLKKTVSEHGYPCLDLLNHYEDPGILTKTDFFDKNHTNVHGSMKFTEYLSQYLIEHYQFEDKSRQEGWDEWDSAAEKYTALISPYALPFEIEGKPRKCTMNASGLSVTKTEKQSASVKWKAAKGADGYQIYQKTGSEAWTYLDSVDADTTEYETAVLEQAGQYAYTVVPVLSKKGTIYYGSYTYNGKSITVSK